MDTVFRNGLPISWGPARDTAFRAREIIDVRVSDPALVGPVIDAALALGITEVANIQFTASDLREAQAAALREATQLVREQAQVIAAASGGRLGRLLYIGTQSPEGGGYNYGAAVMSTASGVPSGRTEVTPPSVPVSVTVYGRWQWLER